MPWLEWLDRKKDLEAATRTPYHLLEPDPALSVGDTSQENLLIQGDNLAALKALLPYYGGQVKCIFIDPPYNTKSAFEHYDDNLEHAKWLSMMYPRLELLRKLMRPDGSIWITIDDNEGHYLKVICDEVFGRQNFVANALWQKRTSPDARLGLGAAHDHVLVYARDAKQLKLAKLRLTPEQTANFRNPDNDPNGAWASTDFTAQGYRPNQMYRIVTPSGRELDPPPGRCWANLESVFHRLNAEGRIYFGANGDARPRVKNYLSESEGVSAWTWWTNDTVGHNQEAKKEQIALFGAGNVFDTPKPERLIQRILDLTTDPNDLVLDSFLGSGTTAAVAHKMGRRWIGIEWGDHALTYCQPRMQKVVEGEQGGISEALGWQGGGGFQFFRLGPAVFDEQGHIRDNVRFKHLAAHLWFAETGTPRVNLNSRSPLLGVHDETAYYLLFNGVLGDLRPDSGNVLTTPLWDALPDVPDGAKRVVVFGEACRIGADRLKRMGITFKQIPYDIHVR